MTSVKSTNFSDSAAEQGSSPIPFELGGETFHGKPWVQGIVLMDFLEQSDAEGAAAVVAFKKFLKDALEPEEYERLDNYLRTAPVEIDIIEISKGVASLIEAYTSRSTTASAQ